MGDDAGVSTGEELNQQDVVNDHNLNSEDCLKPSKGTGATPDNGRISRLPVTVPASNETCDRIVKQGNLKGGGCSPSMLCDLQDHDKDSATKVTDGDNSYTTEFRAVSLSANSSTWTGWAELENDPEIFTAILHGWGAKHLQVDEVLDVGQMIFEGDPSEIKGLIFLSRYQSEEQSDSTTTQSGQPKLVGTSKADTTLPWFANQISKFSCGTVALINIVMNIDDATADLSEQLNSFRKRTVTMTSKQRGIALDTHATFRDLHNSFSTKLDRMIVDVLLKDEAQKYSVRKQAEARQAKRAQGETNGTRGRRARASFTTKRKRKSASTLDEEENGFHFVAFLSVEDCVWKLDGLEKEAELLGRPNNDQTWLNIVAGELMQRMERAYNEGQECSLMSVVKSGAGTCAGERVADLEKRRKQEDWAPFIEHMLRLHAEKGDLQDKLGLVDK